MLETATNSLVNELLISLHRSLVLFSGEVSPWASDKAKGFECEVSRLADRQRSDVGRLFHFLDQRGEAVEFSHYPHEFTSLHFVSLDYLAEPIVKGQRALVQQLESAADQLGADSAAKELVQKIAASQREGLVQLLAAVPGK